jgi:hypothetical protein
VADEVRPALTAEEWRTRHYISRALTWQRTRVGLDGRARAHLTVHWTPLDDAKDSAALVALANDLRPDDDPGKLRHSDVALLRALADSTVALSVADHGRDDDVRRLAAKLAALLPPEG